MGRSPETKKPAPDPPKGLRGCKGVLDFDLMTCVSSQSVWGSNQKLHVFAAWESWEDWLGLQRIPRASHKRTTTQVEIWIAYLGRIGCPTQQCNCTVCRETQVPTHNLWTVCVELCVSLLTYETIGHIWPIANSTKGASPRYNAKLATAKKKNQNHLLK